MVETNIAPHDVSTEVRAARAVVNRRSERMVYETLENDQVFMDRTLLSGDQVRFGLYTGSGDIDDTKLHVISYPFANGNAAHMLLRGMMLQQSVSRLHPVLLLPNQTIGYTPYKFSHQEVARVELGDLSPLADRHEQIVEMVNSVLKTDTVALIDGYSQGAATGAVLAGRIATIGAFFGDAPNTTYRGTGTHNEEVKLLNKAFKSDGLEPLNRAIHDSGLLNLNETQGLTQDGRMTRRQLAHLARFAIGTVRRDNRALKHAMTYPRFVSSLEHAFHANPNMQVTIVRGEGSKIYSEEQQKQVAQSLDGHDNVTYAVLDSSRHDEPYGHAAGDNLLIHAEAYKLLYDRALSAAE